MSLNKDPELKKAVLSLPEREKDKLLVRLVGKDLMLMNQLRFKLLEDEFDLKERIASIQRQLDRLFERLLLAIPHVSQYQGAYHLLAELKYGSGIVNEHFAITKDKMSEIHFRLFLVSQSFSHFGRLFDPHPLGRNRKLLEYVAGRIKYILGKYEKLHEDLQFDFRDQMNTVLDFAHGSGVAPFMNELGLPKEVV